MIFGLPRWLSDKRILLLMQILVKSLGRVDPLEEEMAPHSSILAWRIPWTEESAGYSSQGSKSWTPLVNWASTHAITLLDINALTCTLFTTRMLKYLKTLEEYLGSKCPPRICLYLSQSFSGTIQGTSSVFDVKSDCLFLKVTYILKLRLHTAVYPTPTHI